MVEGNKAPAVILLMRQDRHNLLAFPKLNKAVSILPHEAIAVREQFCH